MSQISGCLAGYVFVSVPECKNTDFFDESVVFICRHDEEGAMGFVLNQMLEGISLLDVLQQTEELNSGIGEDILGEGFWGNLPIFWGGPVEMHKGFVLHSQEYQTPSTILVNEQYGITASTELMQSPLYGVKSMERCAFLLGYVRWKPGQLEKELNQSSWLPVPATPELMFEVPHQEKWRAALAQLGIDSYCLSSIQGEA